MATTAYQVWNAKGRPLTPARPIREIVERMRVAFPAAAKANLFSWYADDAHYQASNPLDHTPYSETPWPDPLPGYIVCATDIMHRPDLGVNCFDLFNYWIAEARAGRMPWLKYLIWQGRSYSVRNGWAAKTASGHYDHIHISTRTDHLNTSLGSWSLTPGGDMIGWLRYGDKGEAVMTMQTLANAAGAEPALVVDGGYGDKTAAALVALGVTGGDKTGKTFGASEEVGLHILVAKRYGGGTGSGVTEERVRDIAEQEAREEIDAAVVEVTVTIKPGA